MGGTGYLQTGQVTCHDATGREIDCAGSGQDGEFRRGVPWPGPRFEIEGETVTDRLTGLAWCHNANLAEFPLTWQEALDYVAQMNRSQTLGYSDWRLPNRRELRSRIIPMTDGFPVSMSWSPWSTAARTARHFRRGIHL